MIKLKTLFYNPEKFLGIVTFEGLHSTGNSTVTIEFIVQQKIHKKLYTV